MLLKKLETHRHRKKKLSFTIISLGAKQHPLVNNTFVLKTLPDAHMVEKHVFDRRQSPLEAHISFCLKR